jgi:hypothetical protein
MLMLVAAEYGLKIMLMEKGATFTFTLPITDSNSAGEHNNQK